MSEVELKNKLQDPSPRDQHTDRDDAASRNSHYSTRSARARAQVRIQYLQEQTRLQHLKLDAEAKLKQLNLELEAALADAEGDEVSAKSDIDIVDNQSRTRDFVMNQAGMPPPPIMYPHPPPDYNNFLVKRELLLSRFHKYNDKPEYFHNWKATFLDVINEIGVNDFEHMDLLIKWLGPESSAQAVNIRMSNPRDMAAAKEKTWRRLDERYGAPELIEHSVRTRLSSFPRIMPKDFKKLYDLVDLLSEVISLKEEPMFAPLLQYLDTSSGIKDVVRKLPYALQDRWTNVAVKYKGSHHGQFPPFAEFVQFVQAESITRNDPAFQYQENDTHRSFAKTPATKVNVHKASVVSDTAGLKCIIHGQSHELNECRGFVSKPMWSRKKLLKDNNVCWRCCNSKEHRYRSCTASLKCSHCNSDEHPSALHPQDSQQADQGNYKSSQTQGGEFHGGEFKQEDKNSVNSKCTEVCGPNQVGKSCAKILPVLVYHKNCPNSAIKMYALVDDQSNRTLASPKFFDMFDISQPEISYTLTSCAGVFTTSGRSGKDFVVKSVSSAVELDLPPIIECAEIPNNRSEIPTPEVAESYKHLKSVQKHIEPIDEQCEIMLLIGRDLIAAHRVIDQKIGKPNAPIAQKLPLGWIIMGESCLGKQHITTNVSVNKTYLHPDGKHSVIAPCENYIDVTERRDNADPIPMTDSVIFKTSSNDNTPAPSVEDRRFMSLMDKECVLEEDGSWVAPLPFRSPRDKLPNNRVYAFQRASKFDENLKRDPAKQAHFIDFMKNVLDSDYAELAPPLKPDEECWFLPLFGVYHPKKPNSIRGVFDASAVYRGVSLNKVLMTGPDLNNSLLAVLLRFRNDRVGVIADIKNMFHRFKVREDHRNYLRFFWHKDNCFENELVEFRMKVHIFGNSPSPSIAIYGLHKAADSAEHEYGTEVAHFIRHNFYVDDGLAACPTPSAAIELVKNAQQALKRFGNMKLHKVASNSDEVRNAFEKDELSKELSVELNQGSTPSVRSLGLEWKLETDSFVFNINSEERPFTRRGVLSTVNSIFDPLGLLAPVTLEGKIILRKLTSTTVDWDEPLPSELSSDWDDWKSSLADLRNLNVSRSLVTNDEKITSRKLLLFCDASESAIAAVAYIQTSYSGTTSAHTNFVLGKSKVAPTSSQTIPRLELCSAVLATEVYKIVADNIDLTFDSVSFYTDSRVVLGYINNERKRFFAYVANRVQQIRTRTDPAQWYYVSSENNPADVGTRPLPASALQNSAWLAPSKLPRSTQANFELVNPEQDREVISVKKTDASVTSQLDTNRFQRFSSWFKLNRAISCLKRLAAAKCKPAKSEPESVESLQEAEMTVIRAVQSKAYGNEISLLRQGKQLPKSCSIKNLNPYLDENNILRVGGRLNKLEQAAFKNPVIIPGQQHVALLIVRHYHEENHHQGRLITEGSIRSAGFWITGAKRLIASVIFKCVTCRKLRAKMSQQIMADLPIDRVQSGNPPFTFVGVDVFGPWEIITRKTRGGAANSKRWAALFTCLTSRAIHIEVLEEMTTSSFINALKRFESLRGKVKIYRSDQGTNFVGAIEPLNFDCVGVETAKMKTHLLRNGTKWIFNPPHSSHMGGAWERMIGIARRILDGLLIESANKTLTHEVLTTFLAEVSAIMNSRPLVPVSSDPDSPLVLSPSMLLTQKTDSTVEGDISPIDTKDMLRSQWKRVAHLSSVFWSKWRREYLQMLQHRTKWTDESPNINVGDVVLLKNLDLPRRQWPMGIIIKAISSDDGKVRKVDVRIVKDGKVAEYSRPITDIVLLLHV